MPPGIGYPPDFLRDLNVQDFSDQLRPTATGPLSPWDRISGIFDRPGVREGLMMAGLRILASDPRRENLGQAVAGAVPLGLAHGREAANKARWDQLLADAPPQMREVMRMLGPERGAALLAQQMMQPRRTEVLAEGAALVDPTTGETLAENVAEPDEPDRAADLRTAMELVGLDPTGAIPAGRRDEVRRTMLDLDAAGASRTVVNLPGGADEAVTETLGQGFEAARRAQRNIARVDRALEIADTEAFESVTGRWGSFKEQVIAVVKEAGLSDGEAIAAADEYQALVGELAVDELQRFGAGTGLSDRDLLEAKGIVGANRSMDARALRAILHVVKESQQNVIDDHRDFIQRARRAGTDPRLLDLWDVGDVESLDARYGIVR